MIVSHMVFLSRCRSVWDSYWYGGIQPTRMRHSFVWIDQAVGTSPEIEMFNFADDTQGMMSHQSNHLFQLSTSYLTDLSHLYEKISYEKALCTTCMTPTSTRTRDGAWRSHKICERHTDASVSIHCQPLSFPHVQSTYQYLFFEQWSTREGRRKSLNI